MESTPGYSDQTGGESLEFLQKLVGFCVSTCFYYVLNSLCMLDVMNAIRNMHTLDTNQIAFQDRQVASAWSPELKYSKIMFWISFLSWSCSSHCGQGPFPTNLYSSMAYHLSVRGFIEMKFIIYIYVYVYVYVYNIHNIQLPIHSYTYAVTYIHTLHYITLHYITLHYITLHYIHTYITCIYLYIPIHMQWHTYIRTYIHYITLHYITLHYITLHYITLHTYILTLHYITLHYITLHYITLHYIHTYIKTFIH